MSAQPLYEWIRVLRYVGTREALDVAMENRQVKGVSPGQWGRGQIRIYEGFIGEVPQPASFGALECFIQDELAAVEAGRRYPDNAAARDAYRSALNEVLQVIQR